MLYVICYVILYHFILYYLLPYCLTSFISSSATNTSSFSFFFFCLANARYLKYVNNKIKNEAPKSQIIINSIP